MIDPTVQAGIEAAKAGRRLEARQILLDVIQSNDQSELAWLWLSDLVDSQDEQQICLENVLTLNPQNELAEQKLAKLRPGNIPAGASQITVHKETPALSLAGAILYPERQSLTWQETAPQLTAQSPISYQANSTYDDIWNQYVKMCAFCAHEIDEDSRRCPHCNRNLIGAYFRYEQPNVHLYNLFVLILGASQMFFIDLIRGLIQHEQAEVLAFTVIFSIIYLILAFGIYFRQFWAYLSTIVFSLIVLALFGWGILGNFAQLPADIPLTKVLLVSSMVTIANMIRVLQLGAITLTLFWAIFLTGPEFDRVKVRYIAQLRPHLNESPAFYAAGKEYSKQGMWATAILHWQRAIALEPANATYQKRLAEAYIRLGFYDRGLDLLQSLHDKTPDLTLKAEISQLMITARQQQTNEARVT